MKKLKEELKGIPLGEAKIRNILGDVLIGIPTFLAVLAFLIILVTVVFYGWPTLTLNFPSFLTSSPIPNTDLRLGGIAPMIFGTFALVVGAMIIAIPLGVMSSIYMSEYLAQGKLKSFINQVVNNLAGVPSIVFGLFGLSFLLRYLNIAGGSPSLVSGWIVLGFMALPIIIKSTNNALEAVPREFREASQALGATKWQTITTVTLPLASPGISTGTILGIGRIVGETAAILFIAVVVSQSNYYPTTIYDPVMALTYHIYYMAVENPYASQTLGIQHATALVLMTLVLLLSAAAIYIRYRAQQRKRGW